MVRLGDICKFQSGGTPSKSNPDYFGGTIPWITTIALTGNIINKTNAIQWITPKAIQETAAKIVPEYSIMVGTRVGVGKVAINSVPMSTSQDIISLINIDSGHWDKKYLCKLILSKKDYLLSQSRGATIKGIKIDTLADLIIPDVSLDEQRRIAATLDKVTDLISKRRQQLDKLDELVKARFVERFGDPDENPKHWQEDELSHHLKIIGGYAFKSDRFTDEGIPILRIGNINSGHFLPVNMVYWPDDSALARYKVFPGDLVMSLTGTVGKDDYGNVCILGDDYDEYYLNQRNAKLSIATTLNKYYFSELLKCPRIKKRLTGINRGIRQANISNKDILTLRVPIPPIELQEQFADFVEQIEEVKTTISRSLEKLETLKKALMQEYFGTQI